MATWVEPEDPKLGEISQVYFRRQILYYFTHVESQKVKLVEIRNEMVFSLGREAEEARKKGNVGQRQFWSDWGLKIYCIVATIIVLLTSKLLSPQIL